MICRDTPPMGGWMGCSVGQWVGSGHITKYPIILDLIGRVCIISCPIHMPGSIVRAYANGSHRGGHLHEPPHNEQVPQCQLPGPVDLTTVTKQLG